MEIIAACAGALMKIVDEIEDINMLNLQEFKEYFQTLCTVFIGLWLYNDVYMSIYAILCMIPASYIVDQIDNVYWKTLIPIPFITFLLKMNTLEWLGVGDLIQRLLIIIVYISVVFIEHKLFPEETSVAKITSRVFSIIGYLAIIYFTSGLSSASSIQSLFIFFASYMAISVVSKVFLDDKKVILTE